MEGTLDPTQQETVQKPRDKTPELAPGPVFGPLALQLGVESSLIFLSFSELKSSGPAHWE